MKQKLSPIIEVNELLKIYRNDDVIIVDVSNAKNAKTNFEEKHLDKAIFIDVNSQLSDIKSDFAQGGRHPLPDLEKFSEMLNSIGMTDQSHVIIYDDKSGANAAARFWWMLRSIGHEKVQVLNGGIQQAEKMGFPTNGKMETPKISQAYKSIKWRLPIAVIDEVEENSLKDNYIIVDVRENYRYRGESEPIDLIAGHIPGSINVPYTSNLDENGMFLSADVLNLKYTEIFAEIDPNNIIVHCGSGITACHTLLAIDYAGLEIPKLYVGSWSEWSRNNKPIATEI